MQFSVTGATAALHAVSGYEDHLYRDVLLVTQRSLAPTSLEDVLANRYELSREIRTVSGSWPQVTASQSVEPT